MTVQELATPLRSVTSPEYFVGKLRTIHEATLDVVSPMSALHWDTPSGDGHGPASLTAPFGAPFLLRDGVAEHLSAEWTTNALRQTAERLIIPSQYLLRLRDHGDARARQLARTTVNEMSVVHNKPTLFRLWRDNETGEAILRAVLSDRYQAIDNWEVLKHVADGMMSANVELADCEVSVDLTDKRFRMRIAVPSVSVAAPDLLADYRSPFLRPGEDAPVIWAGIEVTNSETGHGAFSVAARAVVLKCRNGLKESVSFRRAHVGTTLESGTIDWSDETRQRLLLLVQSQIKDAVSTYISPTYLEGLVNRMRLAKGVQVDNIQNALATVRERQGITEAESDEVLEMFVRGSDRTVFGLGQAVTAAATSSPDGDRQSEMEEMMWDMMAQPFKYAGTVPTPA